MSQQSVSKVIAVLIVIAALAAPTASAMPVDPPGIEHSTFTSNGAATQLDLESLADHRGVGSDEFDWGDAAVGAAGVLIVLGAGAAAVAAVRRGRGSGAVFSG